MNRMLYLSNIISNKNIIKNYYDFEYAGIKGYAEAIGYKIIFFRRNLFSILDAVRFFEIVNSEEIIFCNAILENMNFPLKFGTNCSKIDKILGKAIKKESYLSNCDRYYYKLLNNDLIVLDIAIKNKKLIGLEMIYNQEIITSIEND